MTKEGPPQIGTLNPYVRPKLKPFAGAQVSRRKNAVKAE